MTTDIPEHLDAQVAKFADETAVLLSAVFQDSPPVLIERLGVQRVVRPEGPVPLFGAGAKVAKLDIRIHCRIDSSKQYLAVAKSYVKLISEIDRVPIMRWEYERDAHSKPTAHIQIHGHRGALSALLSKSGHPAPHSMESLHIPVGGARFRPCLEDIVEFLVRDCRLDAKAGWREAVLSGRERWRRYQARTIVRDMASEAADVLAGLGYDVTPPVGGHPPDAPKALHGW